MSPIPASDPDPVPDPDPGRGGRKSRMPNSNNWVAESSDSADRYLDNVAGLAELKRQGYPLEYVVIDDGFCEHNSDWLKPNERFPHGMAWLCEQIREAGLKPGLWLAPYIINANAKTAKEHPEWMMRRKHSDELAAHSSDGHEAELLVEPDGLRLGVNQHTDAPNPGGGLVGQGEHSPHQM